MKLTTPKRIRDGRRYIPVVRGIWIASVQQAITDKRQAIEFSRAPWPTCLYMVDVYARHRVQTVREIAVRHYTYFRHRAHLRNAGHATSYSLKGAPVDPSAVKDWDRAVIVSQNLDRALSL